MLTIKKAMELSGQNLIETLSPSHDYLPYWNVVIERDKTAECTMSWASHNVGRWWDAMLRLEHAISFSIPGEIEAAMMRNICRCFDNPLSVCGHLVGNVNEPAGWMDVHSQRELLLALACLIRFRKDKWAAKQGAKTVRALDKYIQPDEFDFPKMVAIMRKGGINMPDMKHPGKAGPGTMMSHGRLIEALLEFYEATGDDAALMLADRLAQLHFKISTLPDGSAPVKEPGKMHTHSYFNTLRGLLKFGELTRQRKYIERVALTYKTTVRTAIKESGFISHDFGLQYKGETTAPGDAAQIALWLARNGYTEFLDDSEKYVRARILPSQITEPPGLKPKIADGKDEHSRLDERVVGAFGGMYRSPHGESLPTTDITASDLHSLCDIYHNIAERTPDGIRINFHFDYSDDDIMIENIREKDALLRLNVRKKQNLWIRIPSWTPQESLTLKINGKSSDIKIIGNFAYVQLHKRQNNIELKYALPVRKVIENIGGIDFTLLWRGDDAFGISPNTDFFPFYPTL